MKTGTYIRNSRGETLGAVAWSDGDTFCVQITIVDNMGTAKSIIIDNVNAQDLGLDLINFTRGAELLS